MTSHAGRGITSRSYRALWSQTRIELLLQLRRSENVLVSIFVPAGLLLFFANVHVLPSDRSVTDLLPGILAVAVMAGAMVSLGIATGFERHYKVLKRLGGTPLTRGQLLSAKALSFVVIGIVQVAVILPTAAFTGWRGNPFFIGLAGSLLLGTFAFAAVGLLLAGLLRAEANLAVTNALFIVLTLLGGAIIPLTSLPDPLAAAFAAAPLHPLTEAMRASLSGEAPPLRAVAGLSAWGLAASLLAARTFKWE